MSYVPPSPAQATTVMSSLPCFLRPASTPLAPAAAASKAIFIVGILKDVFGCRLSITAVQHAGTTITIFFPIALKTILNAIVAGQPGQAALPGI